MMIRHVVFLDGNFWNVGERRREWIGHVPAVFLFFSSQQKSRRVKKKKKFHGSCRLTLNCSGRFIENILLIS